MNNQPTIIYEDTHLVVLSKPAGLLSQGEHTGDANLVDWLRGHFGRNYVGLIHRLDRNTSGMMIVAKRTKAASRLTKALQEDKIKRAYLGWVEGELNEKQKWTHWLLKDSNANQVEVVDSKKPKAKKAIMESNPVKIGQWNGKTLTLVEFILETGRSHQIRVQAAHEDFPILGDVKYGKDKRGKSFGRPALHSYKIEFPHPMSGEVMAFEAPLPEDMKAIK